MNIRILQGGKWIKVSKWIGCKGWNEIGSLYEGCIMYTKGQENGMARKGKWLTEADYQAQKLVNKGAQKMKTKKIICEEYGKERSDL